MKYCKLCGNRGHKIGLCTSDPVELTINLPETHQFVELFSSTNNWKEGQKMTSDYSKPTKYKVWKNFPPGIHQFKFLIDKKNWVLNKKYQIVCQNGVENNQIEIHEKSGESVIMKKKENILSSKNISQNCVYDVQILLNEISLKEIFDRNVNFKKQSIDLEVFGSWDNWQNPIKMTYFNPKNESFELFIAKLELSPGEYFYKFRMHNYWILDPFREVLFLNSFKNHVIRINEHETNNENKKSKNIIGKNVTLEIFSHEEFYNLDLTGHNMNRIGNELIIFGGLDRDSFTNNLYKISFNPFHVQEVLHFGESVPSPIGFHKAISYGEKLIIYGGYDSEKVSDQYHTYSLLNNKWTAFNFENPIIREMYSVCYKEGTSRIYIFGGLYSHPDDEAEIYFNDIHILFLNVMRFQCLTVSNPPLGRFGHTAILIDWVMYVFGGCRNEGLKKVCFNNLLRIDLFDHNVLEWKDIEAIGELPVPRYGHICVNIGNQLVIYGGYNGKLKDNILGDIWLFNLVNKNWMQLTFLGDKVNHNRALPAACLVDRDIFIFGGKTNKNNDLEDKLIKFKFEFEEIS